MQNIRKKLKINDYEFKLFKGQPQGLILESLQKYKKISDGTLGKYTGSNYTIE